MTHPIIRTIRVGLFCFLASSCSHTPNAPEISQKRLPQGDEYPFVLSKTLALDSPANIGRYVLEAPAGKYGFVLAEHGHFYFENGKRAKFWGTNLCFGGNFPTKQHAEFMVERLAFFGFNAVRLHHMDFHFEPKGILQDVAPAYRNAQSKPTAVLSEKQLDRLDYLIFLLKKRGIYINLNLLVSRHFTESDGVVDANELGMAAKPVSIFDDRLITLQQDYAKALLTHKNPYTGLSYVKDPAIALIEITNENSLLAEWKKDRLNADPLYSAKDPIPEAYRHQLDERWNAWLKERYGTPKSVIRHWGLDQLTAIEKSLLREDAQWQLELHYNAKAKLFRDHPRTAIKISKSTETDWHIQYRRSKIHLIRGERYLVRFHAHTRKPRQIDVIVQQGHSPWKSLGLSKEVTVTPEGGAHALAFRATESSSNAKLAFLLGEDDEDITFSNISVHVVETLPFIADEKHQKVFLFHRPIHGLKGFYPSGMMDDMKQFYKELQRNYIDRMIYFLQADVGVQVPVTGIGGYRVEEDIDTQMSADYIDAHAYWDHPRFPHKPWDREDFRMHNESLIQSEELGILSRLKRMDPKSMPFTVSEWNHCFPNPYAYETPLLMAAVALEQDWDALFQFAFRHGHLDKIPPNRIENYFDTLANPQQLILSSAASLLFLKGGLPEIMHYQDYSKIQTKHFSAIVGLPEKQTASLGPLSPLFVEPGAFFIFTPQEESLTLADEWVIFAVGPIKNTKSGWRKDGTFDWGRGPTLLQVVNPVHSASAGRQPQIRPLLADGSIAPAVTNTGTVSAPWYTLHFAEQ